MVDNRTPDGSIKYADRPPLDWSTEFKEGEWQRMQEWYVRAHGNFGELDRFVPFWHSLRPDIFKRYRVWGASVVGSRGLENFVEASQMLLFHYYNTIRDEYGFLYEFNFARRRGMTKEEAAHVMALAWMNAGPTVANFAAVNVGAQMNFWNPDWDPEERQKGFPWPAEWKADPDAFKCGIDWLASSNENEISKADLERIESWHMRVEGEVPEYVRLLGKRFPIALRAFRAKYEQTMHGPLPKQFIALAFLQVAAAFQQTEAVRRYIHMAKTFGVSNVQIIGTLAINHTILGDARMDASLRGVEEALAKWEK